MKAIWWPSGDGTGLLTSTTLASAGNPSPIVSDGGGEATLMTKALLTIPLSPVTDADMTM